MQLPQDLAPNSAITFQQNSRVMRKGEIDLLWGLIRESSCSWDRSRTLSINPRAYGTRSTRRRRCRSVNQVLDIPIVTRHKFTPVAVPEAFVLEKRVVYI